MPLVSTTEVNKALSIIYTSVLKVCFLHCTFCSQLVLESDYSLWCIFKGAGLRKLNAEMHSENERANEPLILNLIKMGDGGFKNKQKCKESTHRNIIYIECSWE